MLAHLWQNLPASPEMQNKPDNGTYFYPIIDLITWCAFVLTYIWIIVTANTLRPLRNCRDPDFVILKRKDKSDFPHSEQQVALRAFGIIPAAPHSPLVDPRISLLVAHCGGQEAMHLLTSRFV